MARRPLRAEDRAAEGARRAALVPPLRYPEQLPVVAAREELLGVLRSAQVVVVAGETGSGKTTQLPKMLLELGRGVNGLIGHTQPRRIAARSVAERIAEELGSPLGEVVGYQVRFTDRSSDDTLVKVMTDGILLAEIQRDRLLRKYDAIIIDEAHERSLNIDFLLGYLSRILPERPDLHVVVTSATIEPARFAAHFGGAPVVEVSGRTYPVELRYRPYGVEDDRDQVQAICDAVLELADEGPGDVLVFLSGEREIRDAAEAVSALGIPHLEVLPLYSRLSAAEQHRVFAPHTGRRVVLSTNVAETSLTVPGIRYVVDTGTARISRWSRRTKVQRLPIEPVSQASADQRAGRCGRVEAGVAIRLYTEEDYLSRPRFTEPEVQRTNLASVVLQMTALGLGEVEQFPFLDPPDRRSVKDAVDLLHELGAVDVNDPHRLTRLGRSLARLPLDPRIGRMLLEADKEGCLREVLVVAAGLTVQDPRERPADEPQRAAELHGRFADETSDFRAYLNLWEYLREQQEALSSSRFRRMCRDELLHYLRVREWQDLHGQLRSIARDLGLRPNEEPAGADQVHRALLAGLLSQVGLREGDARDFLGARGARFVIGSGSALAKRPPRWVMAGELVETNRLYARTVARVEPEWVERLASHLVLRQYSEPHWDAKRGAAMAYERVTLYGLPLVARRRVGYGRVDPDHARELFLRHALVDGEWQSHHAFLEQNRRLVEEVSGLEDKARRRDLLVHDDALFDFYDVRVPKDVVSGRHFDSWWKGARRETPELLVFTRELLLGARAAEVRPEDFPDRLDAGGTAVDLDYEFAPGAQDDGLTVRVPLAALEQVSGAEWLVPGRRVELITGLIKTLPKQLRVAFVPAPDTAREVARDVDPSQGELLPVLARALRQRSGLDIGPDSFDLARLPDHLRPRYVVVDEKGEERAASRSLDELRQRFRPQVQQSLSAAAKGVEKAGLTAWPGGEIPSRTTTRVGGQDVAGFPSLVDEGASVAVRVLATAAEQRAAMPLGTRRLLQLTTPSPVKGLVGGLSVRDKLLLATNPHGGVQPLLDDVVACALDGLVAEAGGPAWDEAGFAALQQRVKERLPEESRAVLTAVREALDVAQQVEARAKELERLALVRDAVTDVRAQVAALLPPGFATSTGRARLGDLVRYLRAALRRLERLPHDAARDRQRMERVRAASDEVAVAAKRHGSAAVAEARWMVEELRVSLFAQDLGTRGPISEQRIYKVLDGL